MNSQSPHKWWSTLKSVVFSLSSSLPPHVGGGGAIQLLCRQLSATGFFFVVCHWNLSLGQRALTKRKITSKYYYPLPCVQVGW